MPAADNVIVASPVSVLATVRLAASSVARSSRSSSATCTKIAPTKSALSLALIRNGKAEEQVTDVLLIFVTSTS